MALIACFAVLFFALRWSWHNGAHPVASPWRDNDPVDPPLHSRTFDGPGLWGMVISLMANGTLYVSLLFGWFYLWTAAPQWEVPEEGPIAMLPLIASGVLLTLAVLVFRRAVSRLRQGTDARLQSLLWIASGLGLMSFLTLVWVMVAAPLTPGDLAHDAVLTVMLYYLLLHGGLATIFTALQAVRVRIGYVALRLPYEPVVVQPFWMYTLGVFWMSVAAFILLPMAWGGA